jgi:WD40 repeat protein
MGDRPSLIHHDQWLSSDAFSPNSRLLVTTGSDRLVKLWNTCDGSAAQGALRHRAPVRSAAFSPDANTLAAVCEDRTVTLWSIPTGAPLAEHLAAKRLDERLVIEQFWRETIDEWHRRNDVDLDNPVISPWLRKFFPAR